MLKSGTYYISNQALLSVMNLSSTVKPAVFHESDLSSIMLLRLCKYMLSGLTKFIRCLITCLDF